MQRVEMDIVKVGMNKNGKDRLLSMMDYFTKWVELVPIPDERASTVARVFFENWVARWGHSCFVRPPAHDRLSPSGRWLGRAISQIAASDTALSPSECCLSINKRLGCKKGDTLPVHLCISVSFLFVFVGTQADKRRSTGHYTFVFWMFLTEITI
jgi:hypothetical protein